MARRMRSLLVFGAAFLCFELHVSRSVAEAAPVWEWRAVEGTQCRDGSETGFFLRQRNGDKRLVVFLEGGGACFNSLTCSQSAKSVGNQFPGTEGIFQERLDNPVFGWNFVHVPYCTGDIFGGSNLGVKVPGVKERQNFVGFKNMQKILAQLAQMMPEAEEILLTGVSAGGFGADFHYAGTRALWPMAKVVLLDDSGAALEDEWLAPCLQQTFRKLWGLNEALPDSCPECKAPNGGGLVELIGWLRNNYADAPKAMILSTQDSAMRFFYGFGLNKCRPPLIPSISARKYRKGVYSLKDRYLNDGFQSFIISGNQHTFISSKSFYEANRNGQILADWVKDLINGQATDQVP